MSIIVLRGIRVAVFDLDDTLYPERDFVEGGFSAVASWLRTRIACPFEPKQRMWEIFETGDRSRVFDRLLAEMGQEASPATVAEMVACYRDHPPHLALFPDARRALDRWRSLAHLALVSDGALAVQRRKVEALGLAETFDPLVLTDAWGPGFWKPHPRGFEAIMERWGGSPSSYVYLADNPAKDFLAPRRLGWRTVRIVRPCGVHRDQEAVAGGEPERQAGSLDEVELTTERREA